MIEEANNFKEILANHFEIDDWQAVDIILGFVAAHNVKHTEMLWMKLIGASGTGKTELLRAIEGLDDATPVEHITPAAIRGGYKPMRSRREPLLLERINGKIVVTKEFGIMLTLRQDVKTEVFGLLRGVFDGELTSDFGSREGHLQQKSKFDWVIGTTSYIDTQRVLETQLGNRTIDVRWTTPNNTDNLADKAIFNNPNLEDIRIELREIMKLLYQKTLLPASIDFPFIAKMASFVARYRTPVKRDTRSYEIMELPDIESPARVAQSLARLGTGLYALGIKNVQPYLLRVALDTIPKSRSNIIRAILDDIKGREELARYCGISTRALDYIREDMYALGFQEEDNYSFLRVQSNGTQRGPS